jgi:hypothetical protein
LCVRQGILRMLVSTRASGKMQLSNLQLITQQQVPAWWRRCLPAAV